MTTQGKYSFPWHTDACVRSQEYLDNKHGYKRFFCVTHQQWVSEVPVKTTIIFEYEDGTQHKEEKVRK